MITIKTKEDIEFLRESGKRLATVLHAVKDAIRPGVTTKELDELAEKLIREKGDIPAFLHYTPWDAHTPYPASLCTSVNDEVVHGIPGNRILEEGDIIGIDLGVKHKGLITDMAMTVPVGKVDEDTKRLLSATQEALQAGIDAARGGNTVGDIGAAIEKVGKSYGFSIVEILAGHGVGYKVHEEPEVPNYGKKGSGPTLKPGMVLALEPIFNEGTKQVILESDGYTFSTKDGKKSAHFEKTILITEGAPEILTTL